MTSDGRVPLFRPAIASAFNVGEPVFAQTWYDLGQLAHWIAGRGQVLVPQHSFAMVIDNTTETARYYVPGSGRCMYRAWVLDVRSENNTLACVGSITAGATTVEYAIPVTVVDRPYTLVVIEDTSASVQPYAESEITISIANDTTTGGALLRVDSLACYELPRATLDRTTAECGVALDSLFPRRPIYADGATPQQVGIPAVVESIHEMTVTTPARRIGHIGRWGYPLDINGVGGIPLTIAPYRIVPRKDRVGATTQTVRCRVWANYFTGTSQQMRVVGGTAGASAWVSMTSGGWSDPAEIDIDCEDQSTSDGQPAGGYDTISIEVQTDGVNNVEVRGWCVYEYA